MPQVAYQVLNLIQILDVVREGGVARLAMCLDNQPYITPMAFQLEMAGVQPVFHLASPREGRRMDILRHQRHVCLEVEKLGCAWIDTVLAEGSIEVGMAAPEGVLLRLVPRSISGRRFFLPT